MKTVEMAIAGEIYVGGKRKQVKPGEEVTVADRDADAWLADGRAKEPKSTQKAAPATKGASQKG